MTFCDADSSQRTGYTWYLINVCCDILTVFHAVENLRPSSLHCSASCHFAHTVRVWMRWRSLVYVLGLRGSCWLLCEAAWMYPLVVWDVDWLLTAGHHVGQRPRSADGGELRPQPFSHQPCVHLWRPPHSSAALRAQERAFWMGKKHLEFVFVSGRLECVDVALVFYTVVHHVLP